MKHNNVIPNAHFHKEWQSYVRTWFNQPAKKIKRRNARLSKATKVAPRPLNKLRPAVRCPTIKYNRRVRIGRGFTLDELKVGFIIFFNRHHYYYYYYFLYYVLYRRNNI